MSAIIELRRNSGALRCLECGKCSTLCPLAPFGDFSAARMAAIHDAATEAQAFARAIDRCLTCAACETRCPQNVHFTSFVRGLRTRLPPAIRTPCPHGGALTAAARLSANGKGQARDLSWLGDGLRIAESGDTALFIGCLPLFETMFEEELAIRPTEIARAAIRLLNAAGIDPVIVPQERCCGHDLLWSGDEEAFRALANANATAFQQRGVKRIVTACAECASAWRLDYAEVIAGYRPRVDHISQMLTELIGEGKLIFEGGGENGAQAGKPVPHQGAQTLPHEKVTFHDPCRLCRHLGVTDAPRAVLAAIGGTELLEMEKHGVDAQCCGTAGFIHCDRDSRRMQEMRLDSAAATGAEILLTACPKCWIHLACASCEDRLRGRDRAAVAIEDLTLYASRKLGAHRPVAAPADVEVEKGVAS